MASWQVILLAAGVGGVVAAIVNGVFLVVGGRIQASAQARIAKLNHDHEEKVIGLNHAHEIAMKALEDSWRVRDHRHDRIRGQLNLIVKAGVDLGFNADQVQSASVEDVLADKLPNVPDLLKLDEAAELMLDAETVELMTRLYKVNSDYHILRQTRRAHGKAYKANPQGDSLKPLAERAKAVGDSVREQLAAIVIDARETLRRLEDSTV